MAPHKPAAPNPFNPNSTAEWVDEAYSKRLWGRLVRRVDNMPPTAIRSLQTVRRYAWRLSQDHSKARHWYGSVLVPVTGRGALDLVAVRYDRDGRFVQGKYLFRISQHAGERLFERLRTNSDEDLFDTVCLAVVAIIQNDALDVRRFASSPERKARLPWGVLHLVADQIEGLWVAKTFIPGETGIRLV